MGTLKLLVGNDCGPDLDLAFSRLSVLYSEKTGMVIKFCSPQAKFLRVSVGTVAAARAGSQWHVAALREVASELRKEGVHCAPSPTLTPPLLSSSSFI